MKAMLGFAMAELEKMGIKDFVDSRTTDLQFMRYRMEFNDDYLIYNYTLNAFSFLLVAFVSV